MSKRRNSAGDQIIICPTVNTIRVKFQLCDLFIFTENTTLVRVMMVSLLKTLITDVDDAQKHSHALRTVHILSRKKIREPRRNPYIMNVMAILTTFHYCTMCFPEV